MTLHARASSYETGVRDLHDRLSEHLEKVESGSELTVTRRGKPIARVSAIDGPNPLDELIARGLATAPRQARTPREATVTSEGSVSDLITEQRR